MICEQVQLSNVSSSNGTIRHCTPESFPFCLVLDLESSMVVLLWLLFYLSSLAPPNDAIYLQNRREAALLPPCYWRYKGRIA